MRRVHRLGLLVAALAAWWFGFRSLVPAVQRWAQFDQVTDPNVKTLLGHWIFWQLPGVVVCVIVWLAGAHLGLLPSLAQSLKLGGSPRRTLMSGLLAAGVLLALTFLIGALVGTFGFHPPCVKMAGDLVSNLYEEIVHRGLMFCAFYGLVAGATFELEGPLHRWGVIAGIVGSSVVFAAGHGQYPLPLQMVLGVLGVVFAWPWIRARSLWAPWIMHQLGDMVGDTFLKV